jgi:phosphatidate cytidylyltransferase
VTDGPPHSAPPSAPRSADHNLLLRVISALVLAPLAIGVAYVGGALFIVFWAIAALAIEWEWRRIIDDTSLYTLTLALAAIAFIAFEFISAGGPIQPVNLAVAITALLVAMLFAGSLAEHRWRWVAGGIFYACVLLLAAGILRGDRQLGFAAVLFLFAVVWATDILGYFVGRLLGGPKLYPALSPKKTWSGALGGAFGAMFTGYAVAKYSFSANSLAIVPLALLLSAISQAGDLFESAVKRKFGTKDAGVVIPGHGGLMDRLDGFLAAAVAAAIIGLARGGAEAPARGLLIW